MDSLQVSSPLCGKILICLDHWKFSLIPQGNTMAYTPCGLGNQSCRHADSSLSAAASLVQGCVGQLAHDRHMTFFFLAPSKTVSPLILLPQLKTARNRELFLAFTIYLAYAFLEIYVSYSPLSSPSSSCSVFAFASLVSIHDFIVSQCVHFALSALSQCSIFSDLSLFPLYFHILVLSVASH